MGIEFDKDYLTVEQKNYLTKIVNVYIAYDLDDWPKNSTENFNFWKLKLSCLFGATSVVKNSYKEKGIYNGYGKTFDEKDSWSFITISKHNGFARNVKIFGIVNSSSSLADNRKNNFLVLGDGPTFAINESFGSTGKRFSINFSKANEKICLSLHCNAENSYFCK